MIIGFGCSGKGTRGAARRGRFGEGERCCCRGGLIRISGWYTPP